MSGSRSAFLTALLLGTAIAPGARALDLALPTPHPGLFEGGPDYYMYVNRNFQGQVSRPWQGGMYGFVRTPVMVDGRKVYRRFHEGIDIKPLRRDAEGNPLDPILAIDDGVVRHANDVAAHSSYGKYIVIEHRWDNSPVLSLYAHLAAVNVTAGQRVRQGETIGRMGYTGRGLDRARAHLHLEVGLLYTTHFDAWHQRYFAGTPNRHGIYNGLNLFSMDPAALYQANREDPDLGIAEFVRAQPEFFRVRIPNTPDFQLVRRYPWLAGTRADARPRSWEVAFTQSGLAVRADPSDIPAPKPKLVSIKNSPVPYRYVTRGLIGGGQGSASLSSTGLRTMHLLIHPD